MTDAGDGKPRYRRAELERIIVLSFSAGELSRFAERFGVMLDRDGRIDDGARALVRAVSLRGELDRLVAGLREEKPLVEWPEPVAESAPAAQPFAVPAPVPPLASPGTLGAPAAERARPEPPAEAENEAEAEPLRDPFAEDAAAERAERQRALRRWIALGAVFAAGTGLGAFAIVLLVRDDSEAAEPAALAGLAAEHLRESVEGVSRACETDGSDSARATLADAFRTCAGPRIRPGLDQSPLLPPLAPPAPADPQPAAAPRAGAPSREPACLDGCHRLHAACKESECGPEPRSAEKYADHQRCLAECLAKYSRCRLSCR